MAEDLRRYVCPMCKGSLKALARSLRCPTCATNFAIRDGIPDFVREDLSQSRHPALRMVSTFNLLSRFYETRAWFFVFTKVYLGVRSMSYRDFVDEIVNCLDVDNGDVVDVACGPSTLGRKIAPRVDAVYGIDTAMDMLKRGRKKAGREATFNIHLSRNRAETLPFADGQFSAALCGGSLHLFEDPVRVLKEINRTLQLGAPLAISTCIAGDAGLLKYRLVRAISKRGGLHAFRRMELERILKATGFEVRRTYEHGCVMVVGARKNAEL